MRTFARSLLALVPFGVLGACGGTPTPTPPPLPAAATVTAVSARGPEPGPPTLPTSELCGRLAALRGKARTPFAAERPIVESEAFETCEPLDDGVFGFSFHAAQEDEDPHLLFVRLDGGGRVLTRDLGPLPGYCTGATRAYGRVQTLASKERWLPLRFALGCADGESAAVTAIVAIDKEFKLLPDISTPLGLFEDSDGDGLVDGVDDKTFSTNYPTCHTMNGEDPFVFSLPLHGLADGTFAAADATVKRLLAARCPPHAAKDVIVPGDISGTLERLACARLRGEDPKALGRAIATMCKGVSQVCACKAKEGPGCCAEELACRSPFCAAAPAARAIVAATPRVSLP